MTIRDMINAAQQTLEAGDIREAESRFRHIYAAPHADLEEQYWALKGICAALDARGQYYQAETEMMQGLRAIERRRQNLIRQRQHDRNVGTLMYCGAGILAGAALACLLSPGPRRAA